MTFRVSGLKFKGIVKIILNWSDTYTVQLVKNQKGAEVIKAEKSDIYCDQLTEIVDNLVEYTGDDETYKKALNKVKAF